MNIIMTEIKSKGIIKPANQLKSKNTNNINHKPSLPFFLFSSLSSNYENTNAI